jgi:uncharacterized coiled-coil DUF342 family protein
MIQKIKDLMQIKELIDDINKKVQDHSSQVDALKTGLLALTSELADIKGNQKEFLSNFRENLDIIRESKESLRKEIYDFRLLKAKTQRDLLDKFESELSKELTVYSDKLKNDLQEYNNLKKETSTIITRVKDLSLEIQKFTEISSMIKKEDFELNKFCAKVEQGDAEKLQLMKKIDTLERLISRMRRTR